MAGAYAWSAGYTLDAQIRSWERTLTEVLLTHSYHLRYDSKQLRKMQPYAPLGTLYAAAALRQAGISVAVFDSMLEDPSANFGIALKEHQPQIVAVYEDDFNFLSKMCLTRMREIAWDMAKAAKAMGAIAIVHGSDATDNPALFLRNGFDYVLCGESESTLSQLCAAILHDQEVPNLDGMVRFDDSGEIIHGLHHAAKNPAWTELPLPSRDLIDLEPYRIAWTETHGYFSTNMVSSRGCPYRCNWCAKPISGNKFNLRPAANVADEMKRLKTDAGVQHIWFGDDVFALNQHWVQEFAEEVTKREAAVPFKIQSRADLMSEATVRALKAAGCAEVWMGVESGAQVVLNAMDKGLSLSAVMVARCRLKEAGIRACFFLQFGYPWGRLERAAGDHRLRPRNPPRRHRHFILLSVAGYCLLRARTGPTWIEAQLGRQRRSVHHVQGRIQQRFLSPGTECPACRGRFVARVSAFDQQQE